MKSTWVTALVLLVLLLPCNKATAHGIGVEAILRDGQVVIEAFFNDDTPARDAAVTVTGAGDDLIAEGRTDDQGRWTFLAPAPGKYQITIDAQDGHVTHTRVTIPATGLDPVRRVSDGPSRGEFTAFPWKEVALGCGIFAMVGIIAWASRRHRPLAHHQP